LQDAEVLHSDYVVFNLSLETNRDFPCIKPRALWPCPPRSATARSPASRRERDQAKATIAKVAASLPIVEERVAIYELVSRERFKLRANEYSSKVSALEARQQLVEAQHDGAVARHQLEAAEAKVEAFTYTRYGLLRGSSMASAGSAPGRRSQRQRRARQAIRQRQ
jgi:hypothetical protein